MMRELIRLGRQTTLPLKKGRIRCRRFPTRGAVEEETAIETHDEGNKGSAGH